MPARDLYERSQEIGGILRSARLRAKKSMRQCAAYLGTSRERYAGFESGKVYVSLVEIEVLMRYLGIAHHEIWPSDITGDPDEVILQAEPGQAIRIRVNVASTLSTGDAVEVTNPQLG